MPDALEKHRTDQCKLMNERELQGLLTRLQGCFPAEAPLCLTPSAGPEAWAPIAHRFPGGHAERWFATMDGQTDELPVYDAHTFGSLAEAAEAMRIADELRAEPDGYWVEPHWLAIAGDHAAQYIMVDDQNGHVLAVAHDDDHVVVLAPSLEAWLAKLIEDYDAGVLVWSPTFGLTEAEELERMRNRQAELTARRNAPLTGKQKLSLALTLSVVMALIAALIYALTQYGFISSKSSRQSSQVPELKLISETSTVIKAHMKNTRKYYLLNLSGHTWENVGCGLIDSRVPAEVPGERFIERSSLARENPRAFRSRHSRNCTHQGAASLNQQRRNPGQSQ